MVDSWHNQSQATASYLLVRWMSGSRAQIQQYSQRGLIVRVSLHCWSAGGKVAVEPDASSASYPFAVAAATGSTVTVPHLNEKSLQGDFGFVDVLAQMGCTVVKHAEWTKVTGESYPHHQRLVAFDTVVAAVPTRICTDSAWTRVDRMHGVCTGPAKLKGIDVDMHHISDTVMTLAALAPLAEGPTTIRNVANIRIKETDRLIAIVNELRRLGQGVEHGEDWITITPAPVRPSPVALKRQPAFYKRTGLIPGLQRELLACFAGPARGDRVLRGSPHGDVLRSAGLRRPWCDYHGPSLHSEDLPEFLRRLRRDARQGRSCQ